jgi:hypothetical protein
LPYGSHRSATRRATLFERRTVGRLSWEQIVRLNRYLEFAGKVATGAWVALLASLLVGLDWRRLIEDALNSGRPIEGVLVLAIALPTVPFLAARSFLGFPRRRLQRELWRRDVARLAAPRLMEERLDGDQQAARFNSCVWPTESTA